MLSRVLFRALLRTSRQLDRERGLRAFLRALTLSGAQLQAYLGGGGAAAAAAGNAAGGGGMGGGGAGVGRSLSVEAHERILAMHREFMGDLEAYRPSADRDESVSVQEFVRRKFREEVRRVEREGKKPLEDGEEAARARVAVALDAGLFALRYLNRVVMLGGHVLPSVAAPSTAAAQTGHSTKPEGEREGREEGERGENWEATEQRHAEMPTAVRVRPVEQRFDSIPIHGRPHHSVCRGLVLCAHPLMVMTDLARSVVLVLDRDGTDGLVLNQPCIGSLGQLAMDTPPAVLDVFQNHTVYYGGPVQAQLVLHQEAALADVSSVVAPAGLLPETPLPDDLPREDGSSGGCVGSATSEGRGSSLRGGGAAAANPLATPRQRTGLSISTSYALDTSSAMGVSGGGAHQSHLQAVDWQGDEFIASSRPLYVTSDLVRVAEAVQDGVVSAENMKLFYGRLRWHSLTKHLQKELDNVRWLGVRVDNLAALALSRVSRQPNSHNRCWAHVLSNLGGEFDDFAQVKCDVSRAVLSQMESWFAGQPPLDKIVL